MKKPRRGHAKRTNTLLPLAQHQPPDTEGRTPATPLPMVMNDDTQPSDWHSDVSQQQPMGSYDDDSEQGALA